MLNNNEIPEAVPYFGNEDGINAIIIEEESIDPVSIHRTTIPLTVELEKQIPDKKEWKKLKQEIEKPITKQKKKPSNLGKISLVVGIIIALGATLFVWKKYIDEKELSVNFEKQRLEQIIIQANLAVSNQNYDIALINVENLNWQLNPNENKQIVEYYNSKRDSLKQTIIAFKNQHDSLKLAKRWAALDQDAVTSKYILLENEFAGIKLPFDNKEMLDEIKIAFKDYTVKKEIGQQDGPDYPFYSVNDSTGNKICFFNMDFVDTFKLDEVIIRNENIYDQFGLAIGDYLPKIRELRGVNTKIFMGDHSHVFAYYEYSNINYEITGTWVGGDADLTIDKVNDDWKIKSINWVNKTK